MTPKIDIDLGRRAFLRGGALLVTFTLLPFSGAFANTDADTLGEVVLAQDLPSCLRTNPYLDAWIRVGKDGITVHTGSAAFGTGIETELLHVAAERLQVSPSTITFLTADTNLTTNERCTVDRHTMFDGGTALFAATAQVRQLLVESAAREWGIEASVLTTSDGFIESPSGRRMAYAAAVAGVDLQRSLSEPPPPTSPALG